MDNPVQNGIPVRNPSTWERPWSTEEMREQSGHWNLAGDAGLLEYLQEFSQNMISKTHEMEQMMNCLFHETKVTNSKVSNIINEFHMLSNTQFVESRVYDEEVQEPTIEPPKPEETKTKEQREAEVVSKISEALNCGLAVIDQAFERVEILQDSDSEDEDSPSRTNVLLQAKDPYQHRFLPHIIGSQAFHQDDFVGIADLSDEDDEIVEKYEDSEQSSSGSETPPEVISAHPNRKMQSESENDDDIFHNENTNKNEDMFNSSHSSSLSIASDLEGPLRTDEVDKAPTAQGAPLLAEILDAKLKQYAQKSPKKAVRRKSETPSIQSKKSIKSGKRSFTRQTTKDSSDDDLFGTAELPEEEEQFGQKGGLFSGTGKLFDDDIDGLFTPVPEKEDTVSVHSEIAPKSRGNTKSGKKIPAGAVSLFGDDDLFMPSPDKKIVPQTALPKKEKPVIVAKPQKASTVIPVKPKATTPPKTSSIVSKGLFDSDEDEDLFSAPKKTTISSQKPIIPDPAKSSLFGSDEGLFEVGKAPAKAPAIAEDVNTIPEKKLPAGAVSMFGSFSKELGAAIKSQRQTGDSDSEKIDDISRPDSGGSFSNKSQSSFKIAKTSLATKESRSNSVSSNSLFIDDPETDDLFTASKKENSKPIGKSFTQDLFDDEDDSLFSATPFQPKLSSSEIIKKTSSIKADLFDSVDDDNLFDVVSKPASSFKKTTIGLAVSEDAKPEIIETRNEPTKKSDIKPKVIEKAPKVSLFDDEEDDDLFSFPSKRSKSLASIGSSKASDDIKSPINIPQENKEINQIRNNSLFDEGNLFGDNSTNESPEVDLFTTKPVPTEKQSTSNTTQQEVLPADSVITIKTNSNTKPIGGVALFGGVDLFGDHLRKSRSDKEELDNVDEINDTENTPKRKKAPMLKNTLEVSISFDEPVDTSNTLQSAAKDRAKVQTKRRPPSRKGRQAAARNSVLLDQNIKDNEQLPSLNKSENDQPESTSRKEPELEQDLQLDLNLEQDFEPKTEPRRKGPSVQPFLSVIADFRSPSTEEEDLFSVSEHLSQQHYVDKMVIPEPKKAPSRIGSKKEKAQDVVDASKSKKEGSGVEENKSLLFEKCAAKPTVVKTPNIFGDDDDDDDDIFAVSSSQTGFKSAAISSSLTQSTSADIFDDSDPNDIFKSVPSKSVSSKQPKASLFDADDDSDIFSTSKPKIAAVAKKTVFKKKEIAKKTIVKASSVDIFDDPLLSAQNDQE